MRDAYLETERLYLLPSHPALAARVADFYVQNRDFFAPWDPLQPPDFCTPAYQRKVLAKARRDAKIPAALRLWLVEKPGGAGPKAQLAARRQGAVIGMVGLSGIAGPPMRSAYLSYKLAGAHTHRGYAAEAVAALIGLAFGSARAAASQGPPWPIGPLHRLEANIMPANAPSLRLAEKLGFENEGLAKRYLHIAGKWEDHIHMVLLNDEL